MGSFANIVSKLSEEDARNTFECDMLINGTRVVAANEERNIPEDYLIVKGAVFNFKNEILPVEFTVRNKGGMKYFESLDISDKNPVFTKVWGTIESQTITKTYEEESAFGEPVVRESTRTIREWTVTGAAPETYEIGDAENGVTKEEITEKIQKRNTDLAEMKARAEEYKASKENVTATPTVAASTGVDFNF